jgi:hypothetical protein
MTTWHVEEQMLYRYADGELDEARVFSIEAHLLACESCRSAVAPRVSADELDRMWSEVVEAVEAPRPGVVERALITLGVHEHLARLLAATPSLRLSWFLAVSITLAFAVAAAHGASGEAGRVLFLSVAPLLPLAGVAVAFGPGVDPTYEVGLAAPLRIFHLLMIRAAAVVLSTVILAGVAALFLPTLDWSAAAWLLPALGLATASLALATIASPLRTASVMTFLWLATVVSSIAGRGAPVAPERVFAFTAPGQITFLLVALVAGGVIAIRREALERQSAE